MTTEHAASTVKQEKTTESYASPVSGSLSGTPTAAIPLTQATSGTAISPQQTLQQLRDIHLADPISIWPLAPGWYLLGAFILVIASVFYLFFYRWYRKNAAKRVALRRVTKIEMKYKQNGDSTYVLGELSKLIRRVTLAYFPRKDVAGLQGEQWISFLKNHTSNKKLKDALATALAEGAYQKQTDINVGVVFPQFKAWVKDLR